MTEDFGLTGRWPRIAALACLLASAGWIDGCSYFRGKPDAKEAAKDGAKDAKAAPAADDEAATPVTVETAVKGAIDRMVTADAVLYPVNQANVTAKISAPVTKVMVNRGDHVRAGQLLAVLESADLAAAANESQQQIEQAQAAYDLLTGATVGEDRAKAETDVKSARQTLDAAKKV